MNRTKKTALNAIFQIIAIFSQSILALFVTRAIIANIGSDVNGITSTASQLLAFLTLIEGGFTLASQVKMYEPYNSGDFDKLSEYASISMKKFRKIGVLYFIIGIAISFAYTPFIKTQSNYFVTSLILGLSIISSSFNVFFVSKYRLIYQVSQTEYVVYIIQTIFNCLMYACEILVVIYLKNIIVARIVVCAFQILIGLVIGIDCKRRFKNIDFSKKNANVTIEGTKDVFVGKVCGLIYTSAPVFYISTFIGTMFTSIYSVYNNVFNIISNTVNSFLVAPRNALGQYVNVKKNNSVQFIFDQYELASILSVGIMYSVTFALIIPFVRIYTAGVTDVNYIDSLIPILLVINAIFQMIHIPSGTLIEVCGKFKISKIIQTIGALTIIILSLVGALTFGIYGILSAKIITSIILAVLEIGYVRKRILKSKFIMWARIVFPTIIISIVFSIAEYLFVFNENMSIAKFVMYGFLFVVINSFLVVSINLLLNKRTTLSLFSRIRDLTKRRKNKR